MLDENICGWSSNLERELYYWLLASPERKKELKRLTNGAKNKDDLVIKVEAYVSSSYKKEVLKLLKINSLQKILFWDLASVLWIKYRLKESLNSSEECFRGKIEIWRVF